MNPVENYIHDLLDIHKSGEAVKETSYYPPLSHLLNEIGKMLKPQVHCIINIKNRGAGIPDGGLFTSDQLRKDADADPFLSQLPARGAIEVKGTSENILQIAGSKQVLGYLSKYGQVLVTNYRDFILIGRNTDGMPVKLEAYKLAENEADFWSAATNPRSVAEFQGERLIEYLKRVILHAAPILTPEDLAKFLASYARDARSRIEQIDLPALNFLRLALEESLGLKFEGKKGDHFFLSTLVQTIFYGIFSAWVLWSKKNDPVDQHVSFNWREAVWYLHVPMIKALFEQIVTPTKLGPLGLVEVLDWTGLVLNRVDRTAFFSKFEEEHAVQYFYEPFLQAFDPQLRKDLGVWYTPPEIVQYMVSRVDTALREELGVEDGLADPDVYILDPCCGTGTYLVEVLKQIIKNLRDKGEDALGYYDVKRAAMERVLGFEILPAPFVVAHLQLGLLLQSIGVPLSDEKDERAGVYLTNALTGWKSPDVPKKQAVQLPFEIPGLQEERDAAEHIKRKVPILVILGNPPYNAFAGASPKEEQGMVEIYKEGLISEWGIKKFNLDDLYIRFFRLAEHRIVNGTGKGIVCYISNFSYLEEPSYVVMRKRLLNEFDTLWFDCMNGDSRETGKRTPDGKPDPSVFSTKHNREGIKLGTSIGLFVRKAVRDALPTVHFRQFWGIAKRTALLESLNAKDFNTQYEKVIPSKSTRFSFRYSDVSPHYMEWPTLLELCEEPPLHGPVERRAGALIDIDKTLLERRMSKYFDKHLTFNELTNICYGLTREAAGFNPGKVREIALKKENYDPQKVVKYLVKPFDAQWCYYSLIPTLWSRPGKQLFDQCWEGNTFIGSRPTGAAKPEGPPLLYSTILPDYQTMIRNISYFPLRLKRQLKGIITKDGIQNNFFDIFEENELSIIPNLSQSAISYLGKINITDSNEISDLIWMNALSICYSPAYLSENADGISQNWPRIPLPDNKDLLLSSVEIGRRLAGFLDVESHIVGVTSGKLRLEMRSIAAISHVNGKVLNPDTGDLDLTAGWGYSSQGGITMPGQGRLIRRNYTVDELFLIESGAKALGLTIEQVMLQLGETTSDIYLNESVFWKNVPINVWNYVIGGYQVIKKWLSYRERELLRRALTREEVREVTNIAHRVTAILLMQPDLDANYQLVKQSALSWEKSDIF